jgi:ribosomal protein L6P/L9E
MPEGIVIEATSQTDIVVKGIDKQLVGAVSADIRAYRPPEPYKGKGVKYADEHIVRKDATPTRVNFFSKPLVTPVTILAILARAVPA